VTLLKILLHRKIQVVPELITKKLRELSQESVLNAKVLHRKKHILMFSMMVTNKTGLITAMQPNILIHGLRKILVAQELMKQPMEEDCLV
jgi:hypothetical protein